MKKDEVWQKIKQDQSIIYNQSMLDVFLQTTNGLKLKHYLELNDKQKKLINVGTAYLVAFELYKNSKQKDPILENIIKKHPINAYFYALDIIQGRWPEAEESIKKDPQYAFEYAKNIIEGRWPEAEDVIKKNPEYAYLYTKDIINANNPTKKIRWPAYLYTKDIINANNPTKKIRWPEAEEYIKKEPEYAYVYAKNIIEGRWPEAEDVIKKNPRWAFFYAKNIIKDRWPEAEEYIKKGKYWNDYKNTFGI